MQLGERYEQWRAEGARHFREAPLFTAQRRLSEMELQARWFAGEFGREFTSTTGAAVHVVQFGVWNHAAGPDFAEAAISVDGGAPLRGCIELDPDARDWERHGHAGNPDYEQVVLHVFTQSGPEEFFTRTARHRQVPQVQLDLTQLASEAPNPQPEAKLGRCVGPLRDLPKDKVREVLLGAAEFRLKRKAAALARLTELHGSDEALFQALAGTLGYKSNKFPFTLLAQRLPLRLLMRQKDEAIALLFGVAGFLSATDLGEFDATTREYLRGLWEKWWPRRAEFERLTVAPAFWKMSGQRPANHPQRRLAALAALIRHWPTVRDLREQCDPVATRDFFVGLQDEYWDFHYTVTSSRAAKRMALIGESRVTEMLVNVFFPLAITEQRRHREAYENLPAPLANRRVEIAAMRLFGDSAAGRELLKRAAMQQGLLQVYEDFCMQDASDCAHCRFPEQLARW